MNINLIPTHVALGLVIETVFDFLLEKYQIPFHGILLNFKIYNKIKDNGNGEVHFASLSFKHKKFGEIQVDIFVDLRKDLFNFIFTNNEKHHQYKTETFRHLDIAGYLLQCLEMSCLHIPVDPDDHFVKVA